MRRLLCLALGLALFLPSLWMLTALRRAAPPAERLGYRPSFEVTYFTSVEYRYLLSELLTYDAMFYYGSLVGKRGEHPDYRTVEQYVDTATRLNPYNIDAYYFGQAILTWEAGRVKEMNVILARGVEKRTWDFYLPFFLGFNEAFFLHDYRSAAHHLELAAKLNPQATFLPTLVGRFYNEANRTDQAIEYLKMVLEGTFNQAVRRGIELRITALESIKFLEEAVRRYTQGAGHPPADLSELVSAHILKAIPPDPYGGSFYYDRSDGRVKTTSKMAEGTAHDRH